MSSSPEIQPQSSEASGGTLRFVAAAIALAALGAWHAYLYDFVADDTFIGLRYVRNFLAGHGPVFNIGDPVEGYTNFLWLAGLAAAGSTGADLLLLARGFGYLCGAGLILLVISSGRHLMARDARPWGRLVPGVLLCASIPLACWVPSGMETPGYALLVLAALTMGMRDRPTSAYRIATGVVLGLTAWMRPEGLLVGLIAVAFVAPGTGRLRSMALTAGPLVLMVAAQLAFRRSYYGEWAPNTYYAKVGGGSWGTFMRGVAYVHVFVKGNGGAFLYTLPLVAAFWRRDRAWWFAATLLLGLAGGVALVGGDGLPMYRFCVPLIPIWALLMGVLLHAAVGLVEAQMRDRSRLARRASTLLVLLLMVGSMLGKFKRSRPYQLYTDQKDYEVPEWTAAGKWLKKNSEPGDSVACVPVGAVGYYSELEVFDMVGLTDRHIAHLDVNLGSGWAGHEKRDGPYILSLRPTFLLIGNVQVDTNPALLSYRQLARISLSIFASREGDLFIPALERLYEPAVATLPEGRYMHYLRLRSAGPRGAPRAGDGGAGDGR
ncbi:MAG: arabinofuranosyltransferase [Chlamydiales bacterium]|jgi:arabinofuranosyltransferase